MDDFQADGTALPSLMTQLLEGKNLTEEEENDVKWFAASLHSGVQLSLCLRSIGQAQPFA